MNFMMKALNIIFLQAQEDADDLEEIALRLTTLYLEQGVKEDILLPERVSITFARWNSARAYQGFGKSGKKRKQLYNQLARELQDNPELLEQYVYLFARIVQIWAVS